MPFALSIIWSAIVAWLIVRAIGQRGLFRALDPAVTPPAGIAPRVTIIVPARDEEANIGRCLRSLIDLRYPLERVSVIVVDDHSTDATASLARSVARNHDWIRVLSCPPLPPNWTGKTHACWIGANAASADTEWLCFMDADTRAEPDLLATAVTAANSAELDLLSLAPRQELESFAERLILPCGLYFMGFCQDLRKLQAHPNSDATVTGQFMLIHSSAYKAIGGHAAVSSAICEDVALARLLKRAGRRVALYDGTRLIATRMYTGWRTLWPGLSKNVVDMLGGPLAAVAAAFAAIVLSWGAYALPLLNVAGCAKAIPWACASLVPTFVGSGLAFGLHVAGAAYFRVPLWYGLLFPIGYTVGAAIAIDSVLRRLRRRVIWKGRTYP